MIAVIYTILGRLRYLRCCGLVVFITSYVWIYVTRLLDHVYATLLHLYVVTVTGYARLRIPRTYVVYLIPLVQFGPRTLITRPSHAYLTYTLRYTLALPACWLIDITFYHVRHVAVAHICCCSCDCLCSCSSLFGALPLLLFPGYIVVAVVETVPTVNLLRYPRCYVVTLPVTLICVAGWLGSHYAVVGCVVATTFWPGGWLDHSYGLPSVVGYLIDGGLNDTFTLFPVVVTRYWLAGR